MLKHLKFLVILTVALGTLLPTAAFAVTATSAVQEKPQSGAVDTFDKNKVSASDYEGRVVNGILSSPLAEKEIIIKEILVPAEPDSSAPPASQPEQQNSSPADSNESGLVLGASTLRGSAEDSAALFFAGADALIQTISNLAEEIDQLKADLIKLKASATEQKDMSESLLWLKYLSVLALIIILGFIWRLESRVARITATAPAAKSKKSSPSKKKNVLKAKSKPKRLTRKA